jgi:hypothetical protein
MRSKEEKKKAVITKRKTMKRADIKMNSEEDKLE